MSFGLNKGTENGRQNLVHATGTPYHTIIMIIPV